MSAKLDMLRALLVNATGDPTKFQGAKYPTSKHAAGRVTKGVKGRIAGRRFVRDAMSKAAS